MDIPKLSHIHFTGIKGVGMTALSLMAQDLGIRVTGSDVSEVFVTDETLKRRGIDWKIGFSEKSLDPRPDLVITTGAHGGLSNPEVLAAKALGIPVITQGEAVAEFAKGKEVIAVCGVGGKTTTTAMISTIFDVAGLHPSFFIGVGDVPSLSPRSPGRYDKEGKVFIMEADEYAVSPGINNKAKFLLLHPHVVVVTNIEHDHPDIYPTLDDAKKVFKEFFEKVPKDGLIVANGDNENVVRALEGVDRQVVTYGFGSHVDRQVKELELSVPGKFNLANATAAVVVAQFYGINFTDITSGLKNFTGTRRRFENMGVEDGVTFVDDYAHTPNEIKNTLKAAREFFLEKRIIAVFQPHTYSRTKALFDGFTQSFKDADIVGLMDIYSSARETDKLGMSGKALAEGISKSHENVSFTGGHEETVEWIKKTAKPGDVVLTLGAGDIFQIYNLI